MSDAFLFQLVGWLYLALGIGILLNSNQYKKMLEAYITNRPLLFLSGVIAFVVGFVMTENHTTFSISWQNTVVTVISWIILAKGTFIIVFPQLTGWTTRKMNILRHIVPYGWVLTFLGIALLWVGY